MKINKIVTLAAALVVAQAATADTVHIWQEPGEWWGSHWTYTTGPKFTANELSLDMFGAYVAAEREFTDIFETNIRNGTWGGGVGVNYFITREIGIGGDIGIFDNNNANFVDYLSGSLIARLPFEQAGVAPYLFGGGGRTTEPIWEWTGHAGIGFEMRLNPVTGLFVDSRYIWADQLSDAALFRAGLRLVF
jgi:hypothetical protein